MTVLQSLTHLPNILTRLVFDPKLQRDVEITHISLVSDGKTNRPLFLPQTKITE